MSATLIASSPSEKSVNVGADSSSTMIRQVSTAQRPQNGEAIFHVLHMGDLIFLERSSDENGCGGGVLHGDINLQHVGVAGLREDSKQAPWRFNECVFRLCSKLNYFAKSELQHLEILREKHDQVKEESLEAGIQPTASVLREDSRFMSDLKLARERAEVEKEQNILLLEALEERKTQSVKYGDVVQLQHLPSGFFITLQHVPAPVDIHCRKVSLEPDGSFLSKFRVLPRYRGQTMGSPVTTGSGIILQNVEIPSITLGVGSGLNTKRPAAMFIRAQPRPEKAMRLSHVLKHGPIFEVNGSLERRGGFTVRLFKHCAVAGGRENAHGDSLYTSLHKFRMFHPERDAILLASADTDKGDVLDFAEGHEGHSIATVTRKGGIPAHVPYAQPLTKHATQLGGQTGNIKGVWVFELPERNSSEVVTWRSNLRIRHVPSGSYLSVNSKTPAAPVMVVQPSDISSVGAKTASEVMESARFFDVALVTDVDLNAEPGTFGSAESLLFHVVPQDAQPYRTVPLSISALSVEHHPPWGADSRPLYLFVPGEKKLEMMRKSREKDPVRESTGMTTERGLRILFSTYQSPGDALRIYPVAKTESMCIDEMLSQIPLLKLYAYLYQTEETLSTCLDLAEQLCASLLRLLGSLHKKDDGEVWSPLLSSKSTLEYMKNANSQQYRELCRLYLGEQDATVQNILAQAKILDCIFECSLAPYNRFFLSNRPFEERLASDLPRAIQAVTNITLQCSARENSRVQHYFSKGSSRAWFSDISGGSSADSKTRQLRMEAGAGAAPSHFHPRRAEPWHNLLVHMCEDELGSADVLTDLIRESETFSSKVYSRDFMKLVKDIISRFGPQRRLLDILSALCYVDGVPSVARQEMCIREIVTDPYAYGPSFHECPSAAAHASVDKFGARKRIPSDSNWATQEGFRPQFVEDDIRFLGDTKANVYDPVCIAWSSQHSWTRECRKLWWSPEYFGLPVVDHIEVNDKDNEYARRAGIEGTAGNLGLCPIEYIMWPLDPEVLCSKVTGRAFERERFGFGSGDSNDETMLKKKSKKKDSTVPRQRNSYFNIKQDSNYLYTASKGVQQVRERFEAQFALAEYMVAQIDLMVAVCANRSSLCFLHVEKMFSYDLLVNMATNDRLPSVFRSSVLHLINALYLDRYPQLPASGAPHFPEALWVFAEDDYSGPRKSTTPIIKKISLKQEGAFPKFMVSSLSTMKQSSNPIESHLNHRKFHLLRSECDELISFSMSSGIVHSNTRANMLALSALLSEAKLLDFGFMGDITKLKRLAHICTLILDGRRDRMLPGISFESHELRYHQGSRGKVPNDMKKCAVEILLHIVNLRANFRLGKLLYLFKEKAKAHAQHLFEERATKGGAVVSTLDRRRAQALKQDSGHAASYLMGRRPKALFDDFDALFTTDEAADLDLAKLANMKNLDHVIMDCLMQDDDALLASGIRLLFSTYGQRRQLRRSLVDVVLLPSPALPVFGDVHTLRTETNDLFSLLQTYSVWGVKSVISGPFGDAEFAEAMLTVERMLLFLHDFDSFKARVRMQPYSILGTRMGLDKKVIEGAGPDPGDVPDCAIVDPAGLKYIQPFGGGPCQVSGASKSIHKWIGTDKDSSFHPDIIQAIKKPGDAKYHTYHRPQGQSDVHVIHAVGPDFRRKHEPGMPAYTRDEGVELLCQAYHSILIEFVESGQNVLRLTPVSGGAQAGPFVKEIAPLAEEGMRGGFARLTTSQQAHVLEKELHLCIFAEKELKAFYNAGFIPSPEAATLIGVDEDTEPYSPGSATTSAGADKKARNPEYYQGSFASIDIDENYVKCTGLWSYDVASEWAKTFDRSPVMGKFQDILRAFNVQRIIIDTLLSKARMDPRIAWKGSVCTEKEKAESERRLVQVTSALLTLAIKFVTENRINQRIVASLFSDLQGLAAGETSADDEFGDHTGGGAITSPLSLSLLAPARVPGGNLIPELAQELILAVLRGNETLVETNVGPSLIHLFVNLVNQSVDVSTSRAIDLFFVLAKPERQPLKDQQTVIVREILGSGSFSPFVNGLRRCLSEVVAGAEWEDPFSRDSLEAQNIEKRRAEIGSNLEVPVENPAKLVQLVFALIEGGNGDAWLELATHAGVTLDDACDATVKFIETFMSKAGYDGPTQLQPPPDTSEESKGGGPTDPATAAETDSKAKNSAVSQLLGSGTGKVLCDLLVEAVLIVPHTKVTLRSKSLWRFIEEAAVPAINHFVSKEHPTALEIVLVTGIIEMVQHVLTELVLAGLLEDAIIDHAHAITLLRIACEGIMEGRTSFYEELRSKFSETINNRGTIFAAAIAQASKGAAVEVSMDASKEKFEKQRSPRQGSMANLRGFSMSSMGASSSFEDRTPVEGELTRAEFNVMMKFLGQQGGTEFDRDTVARRGLDGRKVNKPRLLKRGALPGIDFFDDAKLDEAFDAADQDGDGSVDIEEFIHLFELVIEGALSLGGARVHIYHRISKRSVECVERINLICAKDYANLKDLKEPRALTGDEDGGDGAREGRDEGDDDHSSHRKKDTKGKPDFRKEVRRSETELASNLEDQFTSFKKAVQVSSLLDAKLEERKMLMVAVLEKGVPLVVNAGGRPLGVDKQPSAAALAHAARTLGSPGIAPPRAGSKEARKLMVAASLQIRWEDLTARLVKYVKDHFKDNGGGAETCRLIFSVWTYHLMKAISDAKKSGSKVGSATENARKIARAKQIYEDKQESLDDCGVTELLTKIIVTLPAGEVGSVQDKAIDLFSELLKGGNLQIQRSLYSYLDKKDTEGKFLAHLLERLDHVYKGLHGCKERGLLGPNMTPESAEHADNAAQSLEFLQLLCEGHNAEFQNFLREQPKCPAQVNLVQKAIDFLVLLVDSTVTVTLLSESEHNLVAQIIAFLTETMQGPCPRNQVHITTVEVINAVNAILSATPMSQQSQTATANLPASFFESSHALAADKAKKNIPSSSSFGARAISRFSGSSFDAAPRMSRSGRAASEFELVRSGIKDKNAAAAAAAAAADVAAAKATGEAGEAESGAVVTAVTVNYDLRARTCELLAACLEGRPDKVTHDAMRRRVQQRALGHYRSELETSIQSMMHAAMAEYRLLDEDEGESMGIMQRALAAIATVASELQLNLPTPEEGKNEEEEEEAGMAGRSKSKKVSLSPSSTKPRREGNRNLSGGLGRMWGGAESFKESIESSLDKLHFDLYNEDKGDDEEHLEDLSEEGSSSSSEDDEDGPSGGALRGGGKVGGEVGVGSGLLGTCEIAWQGKIERTVFPLPVECKYLTKKTKSDFMKEVPLDTADTRMTELIKQCTVFEAEMRLVHEKSVESRIYQFLTIYLSAIKSLMYIFVVLLNLNVLMSPATLSRPSTALGRSYGWIKDDDVDDVVTGDLSSLEVYSLFLTLALGFANFIGYFVIMFHVGRTEVPILIKEYEETLRQNRLTLKPSQWIDLKPFTPWLATLFFNVMCCIIHSANFTPIPLLYVCTFCFVNLPWTLVCIRHSVLVPCGHWQSLQWWYCVAYETVVSRPVFRNHVILQCFSILGFYRSEFFTLMLLDVVNINPTLGGIIKSVTAPGFSLMMVFYLFVVTITIYASFGQSWFQRYLVVPGFDEDSGEETDGTTCGSTLSCFYFLFYTQLAGPLGELREHMRVVDPQSGDYLQRIVYDSVFFIWVGLVLANIITGLMVDTFSAIREEEANRQEVFETQCFVCGLTRAAYDDMSLGKKYATFKQHTTLDHDAWTYVAYLVYLRQKDETEYNGIEAYVVSSVEKRSTDWIPNGTSAAIEAHGKDAAARAARKELSLDAYDDDADETSVAAGGASGPSSSASPSARLAKVNGINADGGALSSEVVLAMTSAVSEMKECRSQVTMLQAEIAQLTERVVGARSPGGVAGQGGILPWS